MSYIQGQINHRISGSALDATDWLHRNGTSGFQGRSVLPTILVSSTQAFSRVMYLTAHHGLGPTIISIVHECYLHHAPPVANCNQQRAIRVADIPTWGIARLWLGPNQSYHRSSSTNKQPHSLTQRQTKNSLCHNVKTDNVKRNAWMRGVHVLIVCLHV